MQESRTQKHVELAIWAANCAEHVLHLFERIRPDDKNPREAIEATRAWVSGKMSVFDARKHAFAAHASAREVQDPAAVAAARAAGHAAATPHVQTH